MVKLSIVNPTYHEEENVIPLYHAIQEQLDNLRIDHPDLTYEHIFIDNASKDKTVKNILELCEKDKNVKLIVNARNFGQLSSPFYGLLQSTGDCTIHMCSDFQDPPELIPILFNRWLEGHKVIVTKKSRTEESWFASLFRRLSYDIYDQIADIPTVKNFTGYALYDRQVVELLKTYKSPKPFIRGLIPFFGFDYVEVPFHKPARRAGRSSNNLFTLYEIAMNGLTDFSQFPLKLIVYIGISLTFFSVLSAIVLVILKLLFWNRIPIGIAPILILQFLMFSFTTLFLGLIGEYILAIHAQVNDRPLVVERFRVNFEPSFQTSPKP